MNILYQDLPNKNLSWDILKSQIRYITIQFSKERTKSQNRLENELKEEQNNLQNSITEDRILNERKIERLEYINKVLDIINIHKTRDASIRARSKWYEEGGKCSKLFLSLEKGHNSNKTIKYLKQIKVKYMESKTYYKKKEHFLKIYIKRIRT